MSSNSFNFNDLMQAADDAGFSAIPAVNDVEAEISKAEHAKTSTGKDQVKVQFKLVEGPYAGKSVFNNFVLTLDNAAALGFFFRHMAALGLPREYFASNPPLSQVASAIVGRRACIDVSVRQWQGTDRNQVDAIRPPRSVTNAAATPVPTVNGGLTVPATASVPASTPAAPANVPTTPASVPATPVTPDSYTTATGVTPPQLPF